VITIEDLISERAHPACPPPEVNPLRDDDALQEAQFLGLRFDAVTGTATLLFDLRMALQLHESNTGVLITRGLRSLTWSGLEDRPTVRTAWTVGGSKVFDDKRELQMKLGLWPSPGAQVEVVVKAAAFFAGDVRGLGDVPPDYLDDDEKTIDAKVANWSSPIVVRSVAKWPE
jgi:hypothetical protein